MSGLSTSRRFGSSAYLITLLLRLPSSRPVAFSLSTARPPSHHLKYDIPLLFAPHLPTSPPSPSPSPSASAYHNPSDASLPSHPLSPRPNPLPFGSVVALFASLQPACHDDPSLVEIVPVLVSVGGFGRRATAAGAGAVSCPAEPEATGGRWTGARKRRSDSTRVWRERAERLDTVTPTSAPRHPSSTSPLNSHLSHPPPSISTSSSHLRLHPDLDLSPPPPPRPAARIRLYLNLVSPLSPPARTCISTSRTSISYPAYASVRVSPTSTTPYSHAASASSLARCLRRGRYIAITLSARVRFAALCDVMPVDDHSLVEIVFIVVGGRREEAVGGAGAVASEVSYPKLKLVRGWVRADMPVDGKQTRLRLRSNLRNSIQFDTGLVSDGGAGGAGWVGATAHRCAASGMSSFFPSYYILFL
ncbi:hypothetical protein R3P38DRAFT_3238712 [Favolaschia claudopus]|uniref:Uncharacterized protein n=1 Tax=Favolaschia claudopus TaxID=2862362 RepID=A0AAV9ZA56_9AGAR